LGMHGRQALVGAREAELREVRSQAELGNESLGTRRIGEDR
jgi:hypothetical protein